ncbi:hypothetical protein CIK67_17895 [Brachybacterium alimentarium]|nr:hypothetical protein CIK67_17895 [Brachybacterium alimentarium]
MRKNPASPASSESVPVSLRTVVLEVQTDGSMTVTIDGTPHPPPENTGAWSRKMFPQIIDQASDERAVPVRVEVHEADGTSFTDLIPAAPRKPAAAEPVPQKKEKRKPGRPVLVEVSGDGFVPGEDVAVAVIVSHTDAAGDGTARALLDPARFAGSGAGEVVLVGRISGTIVVETRR